jgi:hypothetical protein
LLNWLNDSFHKNKKFLYTIAVRGKFDILEKEKISFQYIRDILNLYQNYQSLQIILVAGNKKYVDVEYQSQRLKDRFFAFTEAFIKKDPSKDIYLGADKIFNLTKLLLEKYRQTKAVLLQNSNINDQKDFFSEKFQFRISIYALLIDSVDSAVENSFFRSYLTRRGVEENNFKQSFHNFAFLKKDIIDEFYDKTDLFLFSVEST